MAALRTLEEYKCRYEDRAEKVEEEARVGFKTEYAGCDAEERGGQERILDIVCMVREISKWAEG
jgi:hypothetical protein